MNNVNQGNGKTSIFLRKVHVFMMGCALLLATAFALTGLSACKTVSRGDIAYPESFMVTTANRFDYQSGYECSAFSSSYLLRHYGEDIDGMTLFPTLEDKVEVGGEVLGVYPRGIVRMFQERGYNAELSTDMSVESLKKEVSLGAPVIVYLHTEKPTVSMHWTHYVPIVGYDAEYFYFAESLEYLSNCKDETGLPYNRKTKISDFTELWENVDSYYDRPYFTISKKS